MRSPVEIQLGSGGVLRQALRLLRKGQRLTVVATGWRARRLRQHLPKLVSNEGRLGIRDVLTMWLLLSFHVIYFYAVANGRRVVYRDTADAALIVEVD